MKKKSLLLTAVATLGLTAATMAQNVPNYVPTNGLVGWWPFNGNANDESGNGNNGTVNGATLTADRFGNTNKAYSFDGVNDYIQSSCNGVGGVLSRSISLWVFVSSQGSSGNLKYLVSFGNNNPGEKFGCMYFESSDGPAIDVSNSFMSYNSNLFSSANWRHLVFIYDSTTVNNVSSVKVYLDGVLQTIPNTSSNPSLQFNTIVSGFTEFGGFGNAGNPLTYFNGSLDDIGIWDRVLTQQEITQLYNANICYQYITVTDTLIINANLTSVNPVIYQNTIRIYPNPTNDHITIDYGNFASLNGYQLKIENSLGQQMFQTAINQQTSYISLASWTGNGLYFVHIIDPQGNTIDIRKIVLQ